MLSKVFSILATPSARTSADGWGAQQLFCVTVLVAACASASLVFACATPFAAFAVLAAAMLPLRSALLATAVVWLVNQIIGFGLLGYPWTLNAALWGVGLAAAAELATAIAVSVFHRLAHVGRFAVYPLALVAGFAGYEICLLALTPLLGGGEAFAVDIVGRIAFLNAIWLAGLVGVYEVARLLDGLARRHALQ